MAESSSSSVNNSPVDIASSDDSSLSSSSDDLGIAGCGVEDGYEREMELLRLRAHAAAAAAAEAEFYDSPETIIMNGVGGSGFVGCYYNTVERPTLFPEVGGMNGYAVVPIARDQYGCRCLQKMIDEGIPDVVNNIVSQVKDHSFELMTHNFGNYLIEKIFQAKHAVNAHQIDMILTPILQDEHRLKLTCFNPHGTRIVQAIVRGLRTQAQVCRLAIVLRRITVPLMKNTSGSYVIEEAVKVFPTEYTKAIFDEVARSCLDISTNKCGCSSIQRCLSSARNVSADWLLFRVIISNTVTLSENEYGNYVLKYVITMVPIYTSAIASLLKGRYVQLCMNRHGSHVIENLLQSGEEEDAAIIVKEIMSSREFLKVVQHPFGNFVVQTAMRLSQEWRGNLHDELLENIWPYYQKLRNNPYGKKVLERAEGFARSRVMQRRGGCVLYEMYG